MAVAKLVRLFGPAIYSLLYKDDKMKMPGLQIFKQFIMCTYWENNRFLKK